MDTDFNVQLVFIKKFAEKSGNKINAKFGQNNTFIERKVWQSYQLYN